MSTNDSTNSMDDWSVDKLVNRIRKLEKENEALKQPTAIADQKREELVNEILKKDARITELEQRPTEEEVEKRIKEYTERNRNLEDEITIKRREVEIKSEKMAPLIRICEDHTRTLEWLRERTLEAWVAKEGITVRNSKDARYQVKAEAIANSECVLTLILDLLEYKSDAMQTRSGGRKTYTASTVFAVTDPDSPPKGYRL